MSGERESDLWETPQGIVDWVRYQAGWGAFDFDAAATETNRKAPRWAGRCSPDTTDGLLGEWVGSTVWLNPPYSNQGIWLARAAREGQTRRVAALVMPSFDARYWRPAVWEAATEVWLLEGRIAFERGGKAFPGGNVRSCVVLYAPRNPQAVVQRIEPKVRYLRPFLV